MGPQVRILSPGPGAKNSLSQDERTAHIFSRSTNWQGGAHGSELQRGYELFKLIQIGGVNHLNAEMAEWQTHLTQNQASIPHVGSSPTFGTKDSYSKLYKLQVYVIGSSPILCESVNSSIGRAKL